MVKEEKTDYLRLQERYKTLELTYFRMLKQLEVECDLCGKELELIKIENNMLELGRDMSGHRVWCSDCDNYLFKAKPKKEYIKV